ncbi:MAG: sensor histidine kinase [Pseudomonadota bacterium]
MDETASQQDKQIMYGCFLSVINDLRHSQFWAPIFVFMLASLVAPFAHAQQSTVHLSHDGDFYEPLAPFTNVHIDTSGAISLGTLRSGQVQMEPFPDKYVDFGLTDARIWLRVRLHNPADKDGVWRLDLRRQFVRSLDVYLVEKDKAPVQLLEHTNRDAFNARPIPNRYLAVDVPVSGEATVDLYVVYESDASTWLPYAITTVEAHAVSHVRENSINWLINGFLFAVLILALILAPVVRWQVSLAFCVYIISGSLFVFNSEGYAFQYFWPTMPGLNDPIDLVFILLMAAAGPAFGRVFFDIERHSLVLNRVLIGIITAAIMLALLTFPLFHIAAFKVVAYPLVVVSAALHLVVAIYARSKLIDGSTPILFGATFVLGSMLYALSAAILPGKISLEHTLDIGHIVLLIESIAFAVAIALRLNKVRKDRDRALRSELAAVKDQAALNTKLLASQTKYNDARALARQRRDELSSIRHDIAQPLTSLRAAMFELEGVDDETTQKMHTSFDYLETIARNGGVIDQAIGSEATLKAGYETFEVKVILDNVVAIFENEARVKGLELRYRPSNATIETDPLELMRMVSNLVSNAIKYTASGAILVSAHRRAGKLEIGVRDTGAGMDEATLQEALKKYSKGQASQGAGLGLALVSETARRLGIAFEINSRELRGTTAVLSLPLHQD